MIKFTIWFDFPNEKHFLRSYVWENILAKLTIYNKVLAFRIEETEEVGA